MCTYKSEVGCIWYLVKEERDKTGVVAGNNHIPPHHYTFLFSIIFPFLMKTKCKDGVMYDCYLLPPLSCLSPFWHGTIPTSYYSSIPYSWKLSRVKTFTNFVGLLPSGKKKILQTLCTCTSQLVHIMDNLRKFSLIILQSLHPRKFAAIQYKHHIMKH